MMKSSLNPMSMWNDWLWKSLLLVPTRRDPLAGLAPRPPHIYYIPPHTTVMRHIYIHY